MSGTGTVRRAALATASVGMIALGLLAPVQAAAAAPMTSPIANTSVHTVRTADGYDVYVGGVVRTTVKVGDPAYGVRTALSPDAGTAALITDFDGHAGARLDALDVGSGSVTTIATGRISSAAFAGDGRLGFVDGTELRVFSGGSTGSVGSVGRIDAGGTVELVGWAAGGWLVAHRDVPGAAPSLSRLDEVTGALRPVLSSGGNVVYRDFRLATIGGRPVVTAIRATHVYPCAGEYSTLVLAGLDGGVLREVGRTADSYRSAVWSADGRRIAYELQGCVGQRQKATDGAAALSRLDAVNGVHVLDLATGGDRIAVRGISANFRLDALDAVDGVDGSRVVLDSDRFGARTLDASRTTTAEALDAGTDAAVQARIVPSQFVHQLWDTADDFNGNSACGPTSSVMDLAGYQLASQFSVWVSSPYGHWSPYGGYVSRQYSAYGTTFNAYAPDPNWNYFAGAYGWMVDDPNQGSLHYWLNDYLDRHVSYPIAQASYPTASWIRAQLDANLMVVVSGYFAYGLYGHIALITGYTDDGRFYVNDPYGAGTDGSYDGKNTVYTLDYMRGWQFWAA